MTEATIMDKPAYMVNMPAIASPLLPIVVDHAKGSWITDTDGNEWLDFVMGISVLNTGHCHPKVVAAVLEQAPLVVHTQQALLRNQPMLDLAEKLRETLPEGMNEVMFVNSGAEAVENAIKLAKQATRRPGIIAFRNAFHGRTHLTMALNNGPVFTRGRHEPLVPSVYHARYCYPYRTPASEDPTDYALEDVRRVVRSEIVGDDVAAILVEPLQGEGGFIVPTAEFMQELRKIADEIGALLIIDEVQAGMGRTGKWWCHEHYGVKPDILTSAKSIGGGYPLGAVAARPELWDTCMPGSLGTTFGGNAVACAAGCATIDAIKEDGMLENATRQGDKLQAYFKELQATYPAIGDVRGKGLMVGIECVVPGTKEPNVAAAKAFLAECIKRRLIILVCGSFGNFCRTLPALNLSDEDLDTAIGIFDEAAAAAFA